MTNIMLEGCQTTPVLGYLKALGVLRLVAEQADTHAAGFWTARGFVLRSELDEEGLVHFLAEDYEPTPIVAPWNGRSGFFTQNYDRSSEQLVLRLRETSAPRLAALRQGIEAGFSLQSVGMQRGWIGPDKNGKFRVEDKEACITFCRNTFPDSGVDWIDAVAALASDGAAYSVLLGGSGGNLGSLDLSNNWYQHLSTVLLEEDEDSSRAHLRDALDGTARVAAIGARVGQLDPGRAGGIGRQRGDDGGSNAAWVNPWEFVLGLEGSLLFASAISRRTGREGSSGRSAMPFTVAGSSTGASGGANDEAVRGEVWLPLWEQPMGLAELRRLFGEARAKWDGEHAGSATDFASAVATLGTDRGLSGFERIQVAERLGQSSLAVSVGRVRVSDRPEVGVTQLFDRWLRTVERSGAPTAVLQPTRAARQAQWRLAAHGGSGRLEAFLTAVADVDAAVSRSSAAREKVRPVSGPKPSEVLPLLTDGSPEVALAFALASLRDTPKPKPKDTIQRAHSLRALLSPLQLTGRRWTWLQGEPPPVAGLHLNPLYETMSAVLAFRCRRMPGEDGDADFALRGVEPWFSYGWWIPAAMAEVLAAGDVDHDRVRDVLRGLLLLDWEYAEPPTESWPAPKDVRPVVPLRMLAPFTSPWSVRGRPGPAGATSIRLRPGAEWGQMLGANRVGDVVADAQHRLRIVGEQAAVRNVPIQADPYLGPRLGTAMLLRLRPHDYQSFFDSITVKPTANDTAPEEENDDAST